jgi:hypothetical protein
MVNEIAEHHPQVERFQHLAEKLTATGAVDISNEDLYRYITLSHHGNYRRLLSFSVVHAMGLNAWALYDEHVLEHARKGDPHITTAKLHGLRCRFPDFILKATHQLIAKYK